MRKRIFVLAIGLAVVALAVGPPSVVAQELPPPVVPAIVNIEDPIGDANGLNDQGQQDAIGHQGENVTPEDAGSVSDFSKIWFTNDAETVSAYILTEAPGPAINGLRFDVSASPGEGSAASSTLGCIRFTAMIGGRLEGNSTTWQGADGAKIFDVCNEGSNWFNNGVEGTFTIWEMADGTGLLQITGPRSASPLLADGLVLSKPSATARALVGADGAGASYPAYTDNTVVGTDYTIVAPETEDDDVKPGPGKGKGCKKGKGKKKGCKKGDSDRPQAPTAGSARAL